MQENGSVVLYHRDVAPWRPYSADEYLSWLKDIRREFGEIVEKATET
jgi:hypothetical protein